MAVCDVVGSLAAAAVAAAPAPGQPQQDGALLDDAAAAAVEDGLSLVAQQAVMFGAKQAARTFEQREQPRAGQPLLIPSPPVCFAWRINAGMYTGA